MKPLSEADLAKAYRPKTWGGKRTSDAVFQRERLPAPEPGMHACVDCHLALIPNVNPSPRCHFCVKTRLLAMEARDGR